MKWLVFALLAFVAVVRAEFVPPAEGPLPFRRDKLPVDVDTMGMLSRQVTVLTGAGLPQDASGLRAAAQMTALALALDPANRQARDLVEKLHDGGSLKAADKKELQRACSRSWQLLGWLEMPEAGSDGQALAACLGDVLALADPGHPKAKEWLARGEQGAWKDWIAPESAFQDKTPEPEPAPVEEEDPLPLVPLPDPSVPVPMWSVNKTSKKALLETTLVRAKVAPGSESGAVEIQWNKQETKDLAPFSRNVASAVIRRHGAVNGGVTARFSWQDGDGDFAADKNGGSLSGTATILLDAALTGKEPGAMVFAVVAEDGSLRLPPGFWVTLRELSAMKSHERIILPTKAAPFLEALLVLDDAAFFMDHEVLLAGTADEMCDLASGAPKPAVAEALSAFDEIRKVGEGKSIGSFVAHPSTQARLNKIAATLPQHASARLLALQGSGGRPRFLQRAILAREIRDALQPVQYLNQEPADKILTQRLDEIHEQCRKKLDELFGIIEIRDRDLHKSAVAVADAVRTLARTIDKEDRDYLYESRMKRLQILQTTWSDYRNLLKQLTDAAGDTAEFTIPKPMGER